MCFNCDKDCSDRFWLESPECLLRDLNFVPNVDMTLEQRMNTITRLVIVIFIILLVVKAKYAVKFLLVSLVLIIVLYYSNVQRRGHMVSGGRKLVGAKHTDIPNKRRPYPPVVPEDLVVKTEAPEITHGKNNNIPNPRRPYPTLVPEDLVVKSSNKSNYIVLSESPIILDDEQNDTFVERAAHKHPHHKNSPNDPSGSDLYFNRMKKLETLHNTRDRTDHQSQINSIF